MTKSKQVKNTVPDYRRDALDALREIVTDKSVLPDVRIYAARELLAHF